MLNFNVYGFLFGGNILKTLSFYHETHEKHEKDMGYI